MKPVKEFAVFFSGPLLALFIAAIAGHSQKPSDQMAKMRGMSVTTTDPSGNPCDVMASMAGMKVMGESMAAMTNHMCITPMRPKQPGDEGKAKAVVAQVRATIEKYKDYKKALADGYVQANPTVDQPQFHFNNDANAKLADSEFDPTRPTSLLYFQTPTQKFRLEGVMFTARPNATEDELNERIPLNVPVGTSTRIFAEPLQTRSRNISAKIRNSACSVRSTPRKRAMPKEEPFCPRSLPG